MRSFSNKSTQIEQLTLLPQVLKWLLISVIVAILAGTASAGFLASLEWATSWRETHPWALTLLPASGFCIAWLYLKFGRSVEAGNNLLIDEVHDPKKVIPLRMTPLVLLGTVVSHIFGASVGREGTAIQMGGSLADQLTGPLRLDAEDRRILLMAGMSAGFASVFGVPLAGAIFGLEVLSIGKLRYDAIFPCFVAAIVGNAVTLKWGIHHTVYSVPFTVPEIGATSLISAVIAGAAFGLTGMAFAKVTHRISRFFKERLAYAPLRPFIGGALVAAAVWALGTTRYIGLGVPTIVEAFVKPLHPWDFVGKFGFTALSLGAGFKGGEVTPLFFIGAALGNTLSLFLPLPTPLLAAMGLVAVFAGAANTPLSSTLMAIELFGPQAGIFAGIACVASYLFSGHAGIYQSQRIGISKHATLSPLEGLKLSAVEKAREIPALSLVHDIHFLGFVHRKESNPMGYEGIASLRYYFHHGIKVKEEGFWKKLTAPTLSTHLLHQAKKFGIGQMIIHRVSSGYLPGDPISRDISEIPPEKLPVCAELIDHEGKLRHFVKSHKHLLKDARAVLVRCDENPIFDSAADPIALLKDSEPGTRQEEEVENTTASEDVPVPVTD